MAADPGPAEALAGSSGGRGGVAPSDHPDLAKWLVEQGITAISLNPDSIVETRMLLAGSELRKE